MENVHPGKKQMEFFLSFLLPAGFFKEQKELVIKMLWVSCIDIIFRSMD